MPAAAARSRRAPFELCPTHTRMSAEGAGQGEDENEGGAGGAEGVGSGGGQEGREERELAEAWGGGEELQIMVMREKLEGQFMRARIKAKPVFLPFERCVFVCF